MATAEEQKKRIAYNKIKNGSEPITYSDCMLAVQYKSNIIGSIPIEYKTDEIYKRLFDVAPRILKYIANASAELCEYAIEKQPSVIKDIKDISVLGFEIFEKIVKSNWRNLKYVPKNRITQRLCECAYASSWKAFQYFPDKYKTAELCVQCVKKNWTMLKYVPDHLKTEEVCLLAVEKNYEALSFVPQSILSDELCIKCIKKNWASIRLIPLDFKTPEFYKAILGLVSFSKACREWLISDEMYCTLSERDYVKFIDLKKYVFALDYSDIDYDTLRLERKLYLRKTIHSSFDRETNLFTVNESYFKVKKTCQFEKFEDFYLYLEGNLNGSNLTEYDFEGVDISLYNLEGAYLCSRLLMERGQYNGDFYNSSIVRFSEEVSLLPVLSNETIEAGVITHAEIYSEKLNSYDRKIYYITDIHLNHRLIERFPNYATYDEIRFFIQKYVRKMLNTAHDKRYDDYLLIGGDVSFCFDISRIFYQELCNHWNPSNIVVVLGNHELWDFNRFGVKTTDNSLEVIIRQYGMLFNELGITFLQNALLIKKHFSSTILTEKDILNQSAEELRAIALDSNLIIYGGIGFSAYNAGFNATHGIYRQAITSIQNDLKYTRRSEIVYNKLCEVFPEDKLIVLSHMPLKDWTRCELVPNWIYVNGHTHNNHYIQSDVCTVYADNQMGYKSKSIGLKYFKTSVHYDIFKYYSDGIYRITKAQYMDFNNGNGTRCTFNSDVDYIVMLKRQGLYLFLLEDNDNSKLYLLNGGVRNRLKITEVNYYYDKMIQYADYIKMGIKKYNEALKSISEVVEKIGGTGTIHGCIVDIDFYNHIYLNPYDGTISAYYSPWFGSRCEYPTIEQLLDRHLPQLYANYNNLIGTISSLAVMSSIDISSSEATYIFDTTQYKPSNLIKRLQYITESNVIRIWNDEIISDLERYISDSTKLIT